CSYDRLSPYRMRTVWRPDGSPARANDPVESLTSKIRDPRTDIITPESGRPSMEDRTVPASRAEPCCALTDGGPARTRVTRARRREERRESFMVLGGVQARVTLVSIACPRAPDSAVSAVGGLVVLAARARGAGVDPVATPVHLRRRHRLARVELDLLLLEIAPDPHDVVAAHDGVHRIRLAQERRPVGARDLG